MILLIIYNNLYFILNKNYINPTGKEASIPHPLDEKNVPERPDSHFPKLWNI